jgi:hypothetical protein
MIMNFEIGVRGGVQKMYAVCFGPLVDGSERRIQLVEIKCVYVSLTKLYFQIIEESNYMFWPFSWWAMISLRLEYRRKLILDVHIVVYEFSPIF